jgi:uncharacterized membrane protein
MSPFSVFHISAGLVALTVGFLIIGLRKGNHRHRVLGWIYVASMLASVIAIFVRGKLVPFHGYAAVTAGVVVAGVAATRFRRRLTAWRSWHGALMAFSTLAAVVAVGGTVGAPAVGASNGPPYWRMFDVVIVCFTIIGLWIINTRPVIWGRRVGPDERRVRLWFTGFVVALSVALVLTQLTLS